MSPQLTMGKHGSKKKVKKWMEIYGAFKVVGTT
jgi:hypothetical protein